MIRSKHKYKLVVLFVFGLCLSVSTQAFARDGGNDRVNVSASQCGSNCDEPEVPTPSPPPPSPPPPPPQSLQDSSSDNEDHRRISALQTCCIRSLKGLGYGANIYCSRRQLQTAINRGEIIKLRTNNGRFRCIPGSGVTGRRANLNGGSSLTQSLAPPQRSTKRRVGNGGRPMGNIFQFLFGP